MPWDERQQKNVHLAGPRLCCSGAGSRLMFRELNKLYGADSKALENPSGNACKYRASEMFVARPDAGWLPEGVRRDTATLQTRPYPTFENRFMVGGDRI